MALQPAEILMPMPPSGFDLSTGGTSGLDSNLIDAAIEKVAFIFRCPKTGTLEAVGFLTGTVTTGDDLKVSFQDVDSTNGDPDGVVDQYRVITIADVDDDTWKTTGIISSDGTDTGTKRSVTKGDLLSIVIEFDTFALSGSLNIDCFGVGTRNTLIGNAYVNQYLVSWLPKTNQAPTFGLKYDDGSYYYVPDVLPASAMGVSTLNTGTTPDEVAVKFQVPYSCKVSGAWAVAEMDGDADVVLYDSDGSTVLGTVSVDKDVRPSAAQQPFYILFPSEYQLTVNTNYYLALKPTTATSAKLKYLDFDSTAVMGQMAGGASFLWSQQTDAGGWTDTTTRRPLMGLIISSLDDGVGGGGGGGGLLVHPGMAGGASA